MKEKKKPAVVAVSGVKNSGKTTFLCHLVSLLQERGLSVGVIKHDGHSFEPDVEGTDSYRLRKAGAKAAAVVCDSHFMMIRQEPVSIEWLIEQFFHMDLILLEGCKSSSFQKIELVRDGVSTGSVCDPNTLLAVASDMEELQGTAPKIGLSDYEKAVEIILRYMEESTQ